jgi:hypothetical protein
MESSLAIVEEESETSEDTSSGENPDVGVGEAPDSAAPEDEQPSSAE